MGIEAKREKPEGAAPPPPSGFPATERPVAECPHCGEAFTRLRDGRIPTHDFPRPCRAVCHGSGQLPKSSKDSPLWKDDPAQEGRDFFAAARQELLVYGFAVIKQMGLFSGLRAGITKCPLCGNDAKFVIAESNGHCGARCATEGCVNARE